MLQVLKVLAVLAVLGAPGAAKAPRAPRAPGSLQPSARVETLTATGGLPAHIAGAFQEPTAFQQAKSGRYYVFDRRAHAVYGIDPGAGAPRKLIQIGFEDGRLLQPSAFDLEPESSFVVADAPNSRERVQLFDANGIRITGFTLPGRNAIRVTLGSLVVNGVGSLQYTGRSLLINQPETGSLITEYGMSGTPLRTFGQLRRTGHEADHDLHLALNTGLPIVNPRGGFYFVFSTGVPMYRAYDRDGRLLFERHVEGPEVDEIVANLPARWPRRESPEGDLPLVTPNVRAAAADAHGNLWVSLMPPFTYVYDRYGDKKRTVQFRGATGILAPVSLSFSPAGRLLVAPGLYEFNGVRSAEKAATPETPEPLEPLEPLELHQPPHRPQIQIQLLRIDIELPGEILDRLLQAHEREPDVLGLLFRQRAVLHAPDRLALEQAADELHQREHELHHRSLHVIGIGVPPRRAAARCRALEIPAEGLDLLRFGPGGADPPRPGPRLWPRGGDLRVCQGPGLAPGGHGSSISTKANGAHGPAIAAAAPRRFIARVTADT